MTALRNVTRVEIVDWEYQGEWREDHYLYYLVYSILAHCDDGTAYVHEVNFVDDLAGAERFARRVEERGVIDLAHWGFHEFWSLSLEERLAEEAYHERLHREGYGHLSNGVYSGGHV